LTEKKQNHITSGALDGRLAMEREETESRCLRLTGVYIMKPAIVLSAFIATNFHQKEKVLRGRAKPHPIRLAACVFIQSIDSDDILASV
jgi:hypothetical protein